MGPHGVADGAGATGAARPRLWSERIEATHEVKPPVAHTATPASTVVTVPIGFFTAIW